MSYFPPKKSIYSKKVYILKGFILKGQVKLKNKDVLQAKPLQSGCFLLFHLCDIFPFAS